MEEKATSGVFERCAINGIAENGCAEIFEVNAELVGAAGGGFQLQQAILVAMGDDAIGGLGGLAILINLEGGGAFQVAGDGQVNQGGGEFGMTDGDGVVGFVGLAVLELAAEVFLGIGIFGEDDDTGGIAVKAVD